MTQFFKNLIQKVKNSPALQKKLKWIGGGLTIFFLVIFFSWKYYQATRSWEVWELIPKHTLAVLEISEPLKAFKKLPKEAIIQQVSKTPAGEDWLGRIDYLTNILKKDIDFLKILGNKKIYISWHLTSKESINFLAFFELKEEKEQVIIQKFLAQIKDEKGYTLKERIFQDYAINEFKNEITGETFSFFVYKGFFVGSYSGLLLEDVILKIEENESAFEWTESQEAKDFYKSYDKGGHTLYLNIKKLPDLLSIFSAGAYQNRFKPLAYLAEAGFLKLNLKGNPLNINAYAFINQKNDKEFLKLFQQEKPQQFNLKKYIPNQTAILYHFAFEESTSFFEKYTNYYRQHDSTYIEKLSLLSSEYGVDAREIQAAIEQEIALTWLKTEGENNPQLFFIKSKNPLKFHRLLKKMSQKSGSANYTETYEGHKVFHLGVPEFPRMLLGGLFEGFPTCFFTEIEGVFIFANNEVTLQKYLDSWQSKQLWTSSPLTKEIFQQVESVANFTMVVNFALAWDIFLQAASENWLPILESYENEIKSFGLMFLQLVENENVISINIRLFLKEGLNKTETNQYVTLNYTSSLEANAFTRPFLFRNPENEVLLQDNAQLLYKIDNSGKRLWKRKIGGKIQSEIYQVNLGISEKAQYAFTTKYQLNLMTSEGMYVKGFPIYISKSKEFPVETLSIIDWEDGKSPYFLISNQGGMLYLYDKFGKPQKGWNPKKLSNPLKTPAKGFKVGNDYFVLVAQTDGRVSILNKEGKSQKGFPIQLNTTIDKALWIEQSHYEAPEFFYMTSEGDLIVFDFSGKVKKIEAFEANTEEQKSFELLITPLKNDWLISAKTAKEIIFYSQKGEEIFRKEYPSTEDIILQYFKELEQEWLTITRAKEGKTYLFNMKGELLGVPIKNNFFVNSYFSEKKQRIIVYRLFQNSLSNFTLQ